MTTTAATDATTTTERAKADATTAAAGSLFVAVLAMALPYLLPTDIVRISAASKGVHEICADDDVWAVWLGRIPVLDGDEGGVLERIRQGKAGPLIAAYMAATTPKCPCGEWAGYINVLSLQPQCFACFESARQHADIVLRKEAQVVYALPEAVIKTLPHVVGGASHALVLRSHVEALALEYHGNMEALIATKRELKRVAESEYSYAKGMANLKAKAAKAHGLRAPHIPAKPFILDAPMEVDWGVIRSGAWHTYQWSATTHARAVLAPVPFPSKDDPRKNAVTGDLADQDFTCAHCYRGWWNWGLTRRFPSAALLQQHVAICPNR